MVTKLPARSRLAAILPALCCAVLGAGHESWAQDRQQSGASTSPAVSPALYSAMEYRMIGPYRGGRSTAITGVPSEPSVFYMGTTGGGVWRTEDYGESWENVTDGQIAVASIGAVAVPLSDPNVIYVGTGSACIRGNVSPGAGVYKSVDRGRTWSFIGLKEAGQIGRVRVHPRDANLVYVAALGHAFGRNPERGLFRSRDGGKTWQKVLFVSDSTGVVDLAMDPTNPRILYAAAWRGERQPWTIISGMPQMREAITGLPIAIASRITIGVTSSRDGTMSTSQSRRMFGTSSLGTQSR